MEDEVNPNAVPFWLRSVVMILAMAFSLVAIISFSYVIINLLFEPWSWSLAFPIVVVILYIAFIGFIITD